MSGRRILLEVCVDSPEGLLAAVAGGADRIELCSALAASGLTPSPGLMRLAAQVPIPVYAMIRPRAGDFRYSAAEVDAMLADIDAARVAGLAGVVFGASDAAGALDEPLLARLCAHAAGLGLTLHRAFDVVPDFAAALETAVELGFERILTSGGALTALEGADRIAGFVAQAAGRIGVLAGCGVSARNAAQIVRRTGVREIHGSCSRAVGEGGLAPRERALGFVDPAERVTDKASVAALVAALSGQDVAEG
ncbi:copper homeostasis protein CutC [Caulobacter sp. KR2-114]|uniref:copper homeostasis protein CutC n=1 Tax=Caulobacter sp. KR2-114 TaxID=3400912 RepID=UPI003C12B52C